MAGVREELLLILPCSGHGTGDEPAQQPTQSQQHQQRAAADQQADAHQRPQRSLLKGTVHKGDADTQQALLPVVAHMLLGQHTAFSAGGQCLGHQLRQGIPVLQIVVIAAGDADGAAGQHLRHKAGQPDIGCAGLYRLPQLMGIAFGNVGLGKVVHTGEHRQQYHCRHQHGDAGDLPAQLADHASTSCVRQ